jgi:hypothetical protein
MAIGETGVGNPHDFLEFPELLQETGDPIIDLLSIGGNYWTGQKRLDLQRALVLTVWMNCRLNHP